MKKYLIIHGHFYQPPRENPWIEEVGKELPAYPYHNWNERITAECYSPNLNAIVLDSEKNLLDVINNFQIISFNFGPTLLSWMEENATEIYSRILSSDRDNAIAQVYNHIIMPLASRRDMRTEVLWGIKDFEHRFGRNPKGMWLPETAVSNEALEVLAECGIEFTILAPHQIGRIKKINEKKWEKKEEKEKTSGMFLVRLKNGASIKIITYDAIISHKVSFEGLLHSGDSFLEEIDKRYKETGKNILIIGTDGETYGHHHRFGEMALAYCIRTIELRKDIEILNLEQYFAMNEPEYETEIEENSSWSCIHGIERWRNDCGCSTGGEPGWNQGWRKPLREAVNWLKSLLDEIFVNEGKKFIKDVWGARDHYIDVVIRRREESINDFIVRNVLEKEHDSTVTILKLMEMERNGLLMFTSCGWFFSDVSGIESIQILKYAGRALELAHDLTNRNIEEEFLKKLEKAESNKREEENGAVIYNRYVKPLMLDHKKAMCHFGVFQLMDKPRNEFFSFTINELDRKESFLGDTSLCMSHSVVKSLITEERKELVMAALRMGGIDFRFSIKEYGNYYGEIKEEITKKFEKPNMTEVIRLLDRNFGEGYFTLEALLPDVKEEILQYLSEDIMTRFKDAYNTVYEENKGVMEYIKKIGGKLPDGFLIASRYSLNAKLDDASLMFDEDEDAVNEIVSLKKEAKRWNIQLDEKRVLKRLSRHFTEIVNDFIENPQEKYLNSIIRKFSILTHNGIGFDTRDAQILFHKAVIDAEIRKKIIKAVGEDGIIALLKILNISAKSLKK